jgi:hypothetical protein
MPLSRALGQRAVMAVAILALIVFTGKEPAQETIGEAMTRAACAAD